MNAPQKRDNCQKEFYKLYNVNIYVNRIYIKN